MFRQTVLLSQMGNSPEALVLIVCMLVQVQNMLPQAACKQQPVAEPHILALGYTQVLVYMSEPQR